MSGVDQLVEILAAVVAGAVVALVVLVVVLLIQRNRNKNLKTMQASLNDSLTETQKAVEEGQQKVKSLEDELTNTSNNVTRLEAEKNSKDELLNSVRVDIDRERQAKEKAQQKVNDVGQINSRLETELTNERSKLAEQGVFLENAKQQLSDAFDSLSGKALQTNRAELLKDLQREKDNTRTTVNGLVQPIGVSLQKLQTSHASLDTRVSELSQGTNNLGNETRNLVNALRRPEVRGDWGEFQLIQCVEFAGMLENVNFDTEVTTPSGNQRIDMVINLPSDRQVIVDSKTPMDAYLSAWSTQDEDERERHLERHATQVKKRMEELSRKSYWDALPKTPDFVVLFIPSDVFYSAALKRQPALLRQSTERSVFIATPTTLIALLRVVQMGWREVKLAQEAHEIARLGDELYKYTRTLMNHFTDLHKGLDNSVKAYNGIIGSIDSRFIPKAKQLGEKISTREESLDELKTISAELRESRHTEAMNGVDEG